VKCGITLKLHAVLAVDVFPVPNPDDEDHKPVVFNLADDPEIAQPVSPKFSQA
jgi:hypothetical protein